jgi:hypothetical protein
MMPVHLAGKHRTRLVGIAANRDHRLNFPVQKLVQMLGLMGEGELNLQTILKTRHSYHFY